MKRILFVASAMAVVTPALVPALAGAEPGVAASACLGKPVTIVATTDVIVGTEGDDVVAMTPSGWNTFDARGDNDTICLALGADFTGPRDSVPPKGGAQVVYIGAMGAQGLVNVTAAGAPPTLWFPLPGAVEPVGRGELLVDNIARRATVGGTQVFARSGQGDRLIGGRAQDRANGKAGKFDRCIAEVTKNCERS